MCAKRRLAAFLLVLLVASCCVWAFPGRRSRAIAESTQEEIAPIQTQVSIEIDPMTEEAEPKSDLPEPPKSVKASSEMIVPQEEMISKLEGKSSVKGNELAELIELLKAQVDDQLEAEEDIARLTEKIDELQEANSKQADAIAYQNGILEKEQSMKAFAATKAVIGFKDNIPTWGVGAEIGMRSGKGLMISTGANYMLGDFTSPLDLSWSLDNLSLTVGIGWEW